MNDAGDGSGDGLLERLYRTAIDEDDDAPGSGELDDDVAEAVPGNAARIVGGLTLQKMGDRVADPKTVLAWLLATVSAPSAMTGLLVPIRESGALLPQAVLMPWVRRRPLRHRVWMLGGLGQAVAVAGMAATAAGLAGAVAGAAVLGCLALFATSRALSSIAYKDVLGRTIPKGQRGRVSGVASVTSGVVAIALGLGLRALGADAGAGLLAALLAAAGVGWLLAVGVFAGVKEPRRASQEEGDGAEGLAEAWRLLRQDAPFRRFVVTRALLLVSALSPPFVVAVAGAAEGATLAGLGGFVVAQGSASMLGGRAWGGAADASSRRTMMAAAGGASATVLVYLAVTSVNDSVAVGLIGYFLLALAHQGARLGRKTYVTDMAEGDRRTAYVAASNSAMGVLLLGAGAVTAALGAIGPRAALLCLAAVGLAGVAMGRTLPEVSRDGTG